MADVGLLTTVGVIVSMDSFRPVTDNCRASRKWLGDVEGDAAQALTQLDAILRYHQGDHQGHRDRDRRAGRDRAVRFVPHPGGNRARRCGQHTFSLDVAKPNVWSASSSGAPPSCSCSAGLLIMAVGRAARRVVLEVRKQFREHPGIMDYTEAG